MNRLSPVHTPSRNQSHNHGMCPDQESNWKPFWCMGRRSNQLSHPARAQSLFLNLVSWKRSSFT